jgi:hypothetical protein
MAANEETVVYLKVLPQHLLGGTEENRENFSRDSKFSVRDSNTGHPEYEARELATLPRKRV